VSDVDLFVVDDEEAATEAAAERLVAAAREGLSIVLTGGTTPKVAYERAALLEPDWSETVLWWGDERCVPPEHEDSNYGLAKRALLDRLGVSPREIHRIEGELGKEAAATRYDRALEDRTLDLVLLGIGPDGHAASLFPNAPTLSQGGRALPAEAGLEPFVDRVTMSLPQLCSAGEVLFLVTGPAKANAVRRAFGAPPGPETPASLVRARAGKTTAILDRAAAAELPP
jgi:6-phosphogluconolactonase